MTIPSDERRISITLPIDVARRLDPYIDWGTKSLVYAKLSEMLADSFERHGKIVTGFLLAGRMEFKLRGPLHDESSRQDAEESEGHDEGGTDSPSAGDQDGSEGLEESPEDH